MVSPAPRRRRSFTLHGLRPAGRGQQADACDRPPVARRRLGGDDLRRVARLPFPARVPSQRHGALDLDRRADVDVARSSPARSRLVAVQRVHSGPRGGPGAAGAPRPRLRVLPLRVERDRNGVRAVARRRQDVDSAAAPRRAADPGHMAAAGLGRKDGGRLLLGVYAGTRVVPVFALAASPAGSRFRQASSRRR
jgi:hypothetical protein